MDRSKKRALEILDLYLNEAKNLDFIKAIILVGSLSDDTYTGNAGSDIDLVHIVSDERDYKLEKDEITRIIGKIETQTGRAVPIAKAVYQEGQIKHPYKYDFEIKQENKDLLELPIEMFRIIDSGITIYGDDEIRMNIERPTREDIVEMKKLDKKLEEKASKDDPEWYKTVLENRENPSLRMMTQIVLTHALSDYMYYTDKSCSSKYYILQRMEEDYPELQYMNLLHLCHKYRFHPEKITTSDEAEMKKEYQHTFINRPETWGRRIL